MIQKVIHTPKNKNEASSKNLYKLRGQLNKLWIIYVKLRCSFLLLLGACVCVCLCWQSISINYSKTVESSVRHGAIKIRALPQAATQPSLLTAGELLASQET